MKRDTTKQEEARQKRAALRDLSNQLKKLADMGMIPPSQDGTINGLLRYYYRMSGNTDLKTFGEWKKLGYSIRKGAKAFLLWGKPKPKKKQNQEAETEETPENPDEHQEDFFPIAYCFSSLQVIKKQTLSNF